MGVFNYMSKYLQKLPEYYFDRKVFVEAFKEVFTNDEIFQLEIACQERRFMFDFMLYCVEDEFYIAHLDSGTLISWYKHLGRCNTCNKEGFTITDLIDLLKLLKESMWGD